MCNRASKLYKAVREAVHQQWDPIGVCSYTDEMGEYDSYVPNLCEILINEASEDEVFNFLWIVETESMGLSGDEKATRDFSNVLVIIKNGL
ncbi:hypothetical protein [Cobetia sp. QF-1]|uniref:hypothetical protein n=1 Tax=Cobetia sp. QF-1 TaxID=1969833 RepID=UPI000B5394A7|nr:hypothetical protein [Cobetia sp. QF-1]